MDAMTMMLVLSCSAGEDSLDQFPPLAMAKMQQGRCHEHIDRLEAMERWYGWENGRWATWRCEVKDALAYWKLLEACLEEPSHLKKQAAMRDLKEQLGVKKFDEGWHPREIPGSWEFKNRDDSR